jgi:hypothetical protein
MEATDEQLAARDAFPRDQNWTRSSTIFSAEING